MALRDQPYLPLYVQDFLTDERLMECSASSTGIYIKIMCIMHKSEEYGTILLRQKDKQSDNKVIDFAKKLAKYLPYSVEEITTALTELISEGALKMDGDKLFQKRMVRDNEISLVRADAGSKGGFAKAKSIAKGLSKDKANTEYDNVTENEDIISNDYKVLTGIFEIFRQNYPGTKRGLDIEFENFKKKHKNWKEIVPVLSDALTYQKSARECKARQGGFVPEWKNLQTWINQKCWEEEIITENISNGRIKESGPTDYAVMELVAGKIGAKQQ